MNFTRSLIWLVPLLATSSLAQPRIRIPKVDQNPEVIVVPDRPPVIRRVPTPIPTPGTTEVKRPPTIIRRRPPVVPKTPPVIGRRPPVIIGRRPPVSSKPPASFLIGSGKIINTELVRVFTPDQINAVSKAMDSSPYRMAVNAGRGTVSNGITTGTTDTSVYSDGTGAVIATVKKSASKPDVLATTVLFQFAEAGTTSSMANDSSPWDTPTGIVYYEPRAASFVANGQEGYTANFPIDTNLISKLAGKVDATQGKILYVRAVPVQARPVRGLAGGNLNKLLQRGEVSEGRNGRGGIVTPNGLTLAPARQRWQLTSQPTEWRSIYVAGNKAAVLALLAAQKKALLDVDLQKFKQEIASRYKVEILSYIPPKIWNDEDFAVGDKRELTRDVSFKGRNWKKGQIYNTEHAQNILNKKSGAAAVGAELYSVATGTIDQFSGAWATVKGFAVDTIASALNGSGILDCGAKCKAVISAGINIALAYCGIPPSIPNSRQLYAGGKDYLAGAAADAILEQATGVNSDVFDEFGGNELKKEVRKKVMGAATEGIDTLVDQMGCPVPGAPDCGFVADNAKTWGVPSDYFRKRSGVMYIKISRIGGASDDEAPAFMGMDFERVPGTSANKTVNIFNDTPSYKLFEIPDNGLIIPVVLDPTLNSIKSKLWRINGYHNKFYTIGEPLTYYGQPWYDSGSSLLNGKVSIRTTHLVKSKYAQYPQCVLQEWIVDKKMSLADVNYGTSSGGKGYYGEISFDYAE